MNGHGGNYVLSNVVQEYTAEHGPRISLFPETHQWAQARNDGHEDMHGGELETSILLHVTPQPVRPGDETADWTAVERPHLLTLGMGAYTRSGVIGRPSLGTAEKGEAALRSLAASCRRQVDVIRAAMT